MNRNEQSREKRGGKGFWREGQAGEQDWPSGLDYLSWGFFFFFFLWRSAKPANTFQVSSALKKKVRGYYRRDVEIM